MHAASPATRLGKRAQIKDVEMERQTIQIIQKDSMDSWSPVKGMGRSVSQQRQHVHLEDPRSGPRTQDGGNKASMKTKPCDTLTLARSLQTHSHCMTSYKATALWLLVLTAPEANTEATGGTQHGMRFLKQCWPWCHCEGQSSLQTSGTRDQ